MDPLTTIEIVVLGVSSYVLIATWYFLLDTSRIEENRRIEYKEFTIGAVFWPLVLVLAIVVGIIKVIQFVQRSN
jgi:hypothetical protein